MPGRRTGRDGEVLPDKIEARLELLREAVKNSHGDQAAFDAAWNAADPDYVAPEVAKDD